ncbi:proline iminopeptidase-family hydrolase [Marisediminicola senii]|uniref:proline iminopeptidase-family hydrolase n=1 Tax=Marisediminicola senii TaxID=2711233 RepID=UPI0013EAD735|nr:proline iminopeptidase-family hydrolase [Marisediminicola senii]
MQPTVAVSEQYIPFGEWRTWARITRPGEQAPEQAGQPAAGRIPVIVLHGGPGMAHDYVQNFSRLADTGRAVIHYDQIGCGRSTHLPDASPDFWTVQLFVDEFVNLVEHLGITQYHLVGQSWGGMLAAELATRRLPGLRSLAICNSPASMELWMSGAASLRAQLPEAARTALDQHEAAGTTDHPDYFAATQVFYDRHVCRITPTPADFQASVDQMEAEPTVYHTMNGPNEFHIVGSLRTWSVIDRLPVVAVPTLVVAGEFDEATPETWAPFVDRIAGARQHVFAGGSHCVHLEQPDTFFAVLGAFLAENDG